MFTKILVPLDGSARAERALPVAARIAHSRDATLLLVRVVADLLDVGAYISPTVAVDQNLVDRELAEARTYLDTLTQSYINQGVKIEVAVEVGAPTQTLLDTISFRNVDGVVIGSHGRTGLTRWMLGSVAQAIVRHSTVPVLLVRQQGPALEDDAELHVGPFRILVPLDGSAVAEAALAPALAMGNVFANNESFELHLARVIPFLNTASSDPLRDAAREEAQAYLDRIAKRLEANGDSHARVLTSVIMEIDVADALARMTRAGELITGATATDGFDLIVMATHGRTGLARMAMGSVTERVLSATVAPAFIIRPERLDGEEAKASAAAEPTTTPENWPALF